MSILPIAPVEGQESVWDYPRPPRLEESSKYLQVIFGGVTIAETRRALRILETSHPPVYYIPLEDISTNYLTDGSSHSFCEWKGMASYYTVTVGDRTAANAAWYYPDPVPAYAPLRGYVAFYPSRMDACFVDGELVSAQAGDFYGGWITSEIVGPFKGEPGTWGW